MNKLKISLFTLALLLTSFFSFSQKDEIKTLAIGEKAPLTDYKMIDTDAKSHSLSSLMDKKGLLVVFSCNTCPFVVGSENFEGWEKQYNSLQKIASSNEISMVLINSNEGKRADEDSPENMKKHAKKMNYTMPYLIDKDAQLADAFGARTTPHVYLFDENFVLIYMGAIDNKIDGKRTMDENYLLNAIEAKSSNQEIKLTTSTPRGCSIKRIKK